MSMQALVIIGWTVVKLFDCLTGRIRFAHFCAVFNNIFSRPETASDVISCWFVEPIVLDKYVKFRSQTDLEIFEELISCRTNAREQAYGNRRFAWNV